jgi:hypothetical protein
MQLNHQSDLGTADSFAVLAGQGITNTGYGLVAVFRVGGYIVVFASVVGSH